MTVFVFTGPTLTADAVTELLGATVLPPVRQGDVYRVVRENPRAIGIIDGFFEGVPSVWHKEILWAMEQGISVFGSASMGALRAAELADFGMIGVGRIYEEYHNGTLTDDDEVAVVHGPAELGFMPLSEPMVSIRATVDRACDEGVLPHETATEVLRVAKALNYRDRIWKDIVHSKRELPGMIEFIDWLPVGRVDAKGDDARAMLVRMFQHLEEGASNGPFAVRTERSLMWQSLRARIDAEPSSDCAVNDAVLNEIRLQPDLFATLRDRATLSLLARDEAKRRDQQPDRDALVKQMSAHRTNEGLSQHADLMRWLEMNDLTADGYEGMLADASRVDWMISERTDKLGATLLVELRRSGGYSDLRDRAMRKAEYGSRVPSGSSHAGADRLRMLMWYFETHLDREVPDDLESYAASVGLSGREAFYDLIEAEFLFCQMDVDSDQKKPAE
ncbi:TfuA-like protein [Roseibium sp. RKSG952]|uniref:TfuA-like protein n=1 Tax=Roseibium sp. RKSG952 TaxID=2529384 RepID=UPI0012BD7A96|nr:TfuA-like protein [Roseibium sp. RKSG952]MTI01953.1 hypothetical protein [Roseibium sp. RKSG952]